MARGGWILTGDAKRLRRLLRAQRELARSLEQKLLVERRLLSALEETRTEILLTLERAGISGVVLSAAAVRRLVELDGDISARQQGVRDVAGQVLGARGRQRGLADRATRRDSVQLRKELEDDAREMTLAMLGKAAGKQDVVK